MHHFDAHFPNNILREGDPSPYHNIVPFPLDPLLIVELSDFVLLNFSGETRHSKKLLTAPFIIRRTTTALLLLLLLLLVHAT